MARCRRLGRGEVGPRGLAEGPNDFPSVPASACRNIDKAIAATDAAQLLFSIVDKLDAATILIRHA